MIMQRFAWLSWVCFFALSLALVSSSQGVTLSDLRTEILASEGQLSNLKVHSDYHGERWDAQSKAWRQACDAELTAWFLGIPGSKARLDFSRNSLPWTDGAAATTDAVYDYAYNGQVTQMLLRQTGDTRNPVQVLRGEVFPSRQEIFTTYGGDACGWTSSLYGVLDFQGMRVSEMLQQAENRQLPPSALQLSNVRITETNCVKLFNSSMQRSFYFDPARRYALMGQDVMSAGKLIAATRVTSLTEPSPGVFYPTQVTSLIYDSNSGQPVSRTIYHASSIVVNDPHFDEGVFQMKWPSKTAILDHTTNKVLVIADADEIVDKSIEDQVAHVKIESPPTTMATTLPNQASVPTPAVGGGTARRNRWGTIALFMIIGAVVLVTIFHRRVRTSIPVIALTILLHPSLLAHAETDPYVGAAIGQQNMDNCGVNIAVFTLRYFNCPLNWSERIKGDVDNPVRHDGRTDRVFSYFALITSKYGMRMLRDRCETDDSLL